MCDSVLRRSNNTGRGDEAHGLDTSILDRVVDRTTSPTPSGTTIPPASLEELAITLPDRKAVTKADNASKRKASTGPEISSNATKRIRSSKKGFEVGPSRQAAGDGVKQDDDGTLDDDDQCDDPEFAMEDIESLNDDVDDGRNDSDGNVDPYYEARFGNTAGDVLRRDILPLVPGPYYIPYPYDEGSGSDSPPYTKDDLKEIHRVNLGLRKKSFTRILRIAV
uniref:Uncharacterized protein n=1 Tax=Tanacetum cinerariifolium TaxID=118510 RepID=A0A699I3K3_TANCI|nr:hypothetical protein [Tanacetum cinerariifolium]